MDRSQRAALVHGLALLLLVLTICVGCHGKATAPAPTASAAQEPLQRRLPTSDAEPAPLPQQTAEKAESAPVPLLAEKPVTDLIQPSSVDPKPAVAINERQGLPIPPEPISTSVDSAPAPADSPADIAAPANGKEHAEFSISSEDAAKAATPPPAVAVPPLISAAPAQPQTASQPAVSSAPPRKEIPAAPVQRKEAELPKADPPKRDKSAEIKSEPTPAAEDTVDSETQLPWGPSTPTPEMMAIAKRAEETARHGFDLAERGALYTARARFIEALRTLAQAIDAQRDNMAHTKALSAGLRAMEEVDDFVPRGASLETDLNLKLIVDAHRTPVLKGRSLDKVTVTEAQRLYLTYAQEQLAAGAGDQAVASLALHGLGKVCAAPSAMHGPQEKIAECKAVVFYQAALVVEPRNFLAANELGVLLVRFGRLDDACKVLEQAVAVSNAPTSWRNLATVYERLGNAQRAQQARQQAEIAVAQLQKEGYANAGMRYPINWLDPDSFARTNSMVGDTHSVVSPQQAPSALPQQQSASANPQPAPAVPQTAAIPDKKPSNWWGLK